MLREPALNLATVGIENILLEIVAPTSSAMSICRSGLLTAIMHGVIEELTQNYKLSNFKDKLFSWLKIQAQIKSITYRKFEYRLIDARWALKHAPESCEKASATTMPVTSHITSLEPLFYPQNETFKPYYEGISGATC